MVFAWIAVAVLCSIHLIFSLVQSWVESKNIRTAYGAFMELTIFSIF